MTTGYAAHTTPSHSAPGTSLSGRSAHVLFLIDELCRKGGTETALLNTVRWLPVRFRCSIATFRLNPELSILADFPCAIQVFPLRRTYDWNAVRMAAKLSSFIRTERVDVVHTFFPSSDLWGGVVAKLSRRPILISSRRDLGILRSTTHKIAYRTLHGMFDRVLTNSEEVRVFTIQQDKLDSARVRTIHNGIDTTRYSEANDVSEKTTPDCFPDASHVIVSVGNLRMVKGFDILIKAAAVVAREYPQVLFVIAGGEDPAESHLRGELESLSSSLSIQRNIKFIGGIADPAQVLSKAQVFCLLSRSEGFSNALLEAMACGLPCVATRIGGNSEAVADGETGFIVAGEDHNSAAVRILDLLGDPIRARQMGHAARRRVEKHFSHHAYTSKLVEVYDALLAKREDAR